VQAARSLLGEEAFAVAWAEGQIRLYERAIIEDALSQDPGR
jgi:hypothetical protein